MSTDPIQNVEEQRGKPLQRTSGAVAGVQEVFGPFYPNIRDFSRVLSLVAVGGAGVVQLLRTDGQVITPSQAQMVANPSVAQLTIAGAVWAQYTLVAGVPIQEQPWEEFTWEGAFWVAVKPSTTTPITVRLSQ